MKTIIPTTLAALVCAGFAVCYSGCHNAIAEAETSKEQSNEENATQDEADKLYALVTQARAEIREIRQAAGLHAHASGPHIDPPGHHDGESEADRARERKEGEGHEDGEHREDRERGHREGREREHGEREHREGRERGHREGRERGEHSDRGEHRERSEHGERERGEHGNREGTRNRMAKLEKHDKTYKNGARLTLKYNPATQAFGGNVQNTTKKTMSQMRVEIHLSNGVELGPTKRVDLKPGETTPVELSAVDQKFSHWVTHPEAGNEEAHADGDEESERHAGGHRSERGEHSNRERGEHDREQGEHARSEKGEHGQSGGHEAHTKAAASLRPISNQIQLLRGELKALKADLKAKGK